MYSIDRNNIMRETVKSKWDRYSQGRDDFEKIVCSSPVNLEDALRIKEYMHAVDSDESIIGDIRISMASIISFPTEENIEFWQNNFVRCAKSIIESNPHGKQIVEQMLKALESELGRLPDAIQFRMDTELKSEGYIDFVMAIIKSAISGAGAMILLETSSTEYLYAGEDNRNGLFIDGCTYEKGSQLFPCGSLTPIGYNSSLDIPSKNDEASINIVIPFDRVVSNRNNYLVKSKGSFGSTNN